MDWMSVKDQIPDEGVQVLTYDERLEEFRLDYIVTYEDNDPPYIWACRYVSDWENVSHWMPLPERPK